MATSKDNFIQRAIRLKTGTEKGLQAVGGQIRRNVVQGEQDFKSGKMQYYGSINPFKGTGNAFKQAANY